MNIFRRNKLALKIVFNNKKYILLMLAGSLISLCVYYLALVSIIPFNTFINANGSFYVILQIFSSIANSMLLGITISLFIFSLKQKKRNNNLTFSQTIASIFVSLAITGCYACGTVLFPSLGIITAFASLPFGGLEIKVLVFILMLYSIDQYSQNILGICAIKKRKDISLHTSVGDINIKVNRLLRLKPLFISFVFIVLAFLLPGIFANIGFSNNIQTGSSNHICQTK